MANSMRPGSGIQYEVFNDKVIRATLNGTDYDAERSINKILYSVPTSVINFYTKSSLDNGCCGMAHSYVGKAKVNTEEGDTFDYEVGSKLARERCLDKYHKAFDSRIAWALEDARSMVAWIEHYAEKKNIDTSGIASVEELKEVYFRGMKNK